MADSSLKQQEADWVFDFVMNLFESPTWEVPIMSFIDENCAIFDNNDENKFSYTDSHEEFKDLVNNIISSNLMEIGITDEDFAEICARCRYATEMSLNVVNQIIAIDDFITYKKLMVKRNLELELEAVQMFKQEEERKEEAAKAARVAKRKAEEIQESEEEDSDEEFNEETEEQIRASVDSQLLEMELLYKREEMEQAELEAAIAMSIAVEEERLRIANVKSKQAEDRDAGSTSSNSSYNIDNIQESVDNSKKKAREVYDRNQKALAEQRKRHQELREEAEVSENEIFARAKHLREQRDRILAKKKKDREEKLLAFEEKQRENAEKLPKQIQQRVDDNRAVEVDAKSTEADEKRKALRIALARRMKQDLLDSADGERNSQYQIHQMEDLDEKLRKVESIRRENQQIEENTYTKVAKQQARRSRNARKAQ